MPRLTSLSTPFAGGLQNATRVPIVPIHLALLAGQKPLINCELAAAKFPIELLQLWLHWLQR
jgi:hypothetical protein